MNYYNGNNTRCGFRTNWVIKVEIVIPNRRLKRTLEDDKLCAKEFGVPMAKFLRRRLDALAAAKCLRDFWPPKSKPERVHRLTGRKGHVYSVDLKQPYRLIFLHTPEDPHSFDDTEKFWALVEIIEIVGIEDTHG